MRKSSLNEHISRMKYLTKYDGKKSMNESVVANEQIDANEVAAFEQEMTTALNQVMADLPAELAQAAKTTGDRDGQLEIAGDPQATQQPTQQAQPATQPIQSIQELELDEALVSLLGGTALALPAITKLIGSAAAFLGKKTDSTKLQQFGASAKHFAEKMHHTYEHVIDKVLSPLTKNLDPNKRKTINKLVFYAIVATFFGVGATGAVGAVGAGQTGLAAAEGGLSSIKAGELVAAVRQVIPKIISQVGIV
jgi:hypothetical protein